MDSTSILEWLISDGRVRVPASELAQTSEGQTVHLSAGLAELMEAGSVEAWEDEDGVAVLTLSSLTAAQLGLEMDDSLRKWLSPWQTRSPVPLELLMAAGIKVVLASDLRSSTSDGGSRDYDLGWVVDDRTVDPGEVVDAIERAEDAAGAILAQRRAIEIARTVYGRRHPACPEPVRGPLLPVIILTGVTPWPPGGPIRGAQAPELPLRDRENEVGPCSVCKGKPMFAATYCAWCDRSGVDYLLPKVEGPRPTRRKRSGLSGGTEDKAGKRA